MREKFKPGTMVWWSSWNVTPYTPPRLAMVRETTELGIRIQPLEVWAGEDETRVEPASTLRPVNRGRQSGVVIPMVLTIAIGVSALGLVVTDVFAPVVLGITALHEHLHAGHHTHDGHTH